jgi:uncharacterized protein GlcG (DUF336 family)
MSPSLYVDADRAPRKIVAAAESDAARTYFAGVAVVDDGGWPILASARTTRPMSPSVELAFGKARTAA